MELTPFFILYACIYAYQYLVVVKLQECNSNLHTEENKLVVQCCFNSKFNMTCTSLMDSKMPTKSHSPPIKINKKVYDELA